MDIRKEALTARQPVVGDILITAQEICERVAVLGTEIDAHYAGAERPLVLVCVLTGALVFTADLARALTIDVELHCVAVRSYGDATVSSGRVDIVHDATTALGGRDVLLVEDVVDTGGTAHFLLDRFAAQRPRSLRLVAVFDKVSRRRRAVRVDWRGFEIADHFVVGYGLDHAGRHRNLPDLHVLVEG
ncbi:MAG: hypoxanthine phosphoribosyltransferase [Candidatus Dormibacteraeota bacterium]|nr:hypoxanthine phosphoribosyltransferase [Candidatus Dormibacteraeota bacterium]